MDQSMWAFFGVVVAEAAGIIGLLIKSSADRNKAAREQARRDQNIEDRLKNLEKKVDEHNGYAKLFAEEAKKNSEFAIAQTAMQKDVEWIKQRFLQHN